MSLWHMERLNCRRQRKVNALFNLTQNDKGSTENEIQQHKTSSFASSWLSFLLSSDNRGDKQIWDEPYRPSWTFKCCNLWRNIGTESFHTENQALAFSAILSAYYSRNGRSVYCVDRLLELKAGNLNCKLNCKHEDTSHVLTFNLSAFTTLVQCTRLLLCFLYK